MSDWNSVQNTSPSTYREQVITSVNAGIDMLMEVDSYDLAMDIIVNAVKSREIAEERVNDAVLCGSSSFTGRLPSPWYSSTEQIGTDECMFEEGYGLSY